MRLFCIIGLPLIPWIIPPVCLIRRSSVILIFIPFISLVFWFCNSIILISKASTLSLSNTVKILALPNRTSFCVAIFNFCLLLYLLLSILPYIPVLVLLLILPTFSLLNIAFLAPGLPLTLLFILVTSAFFITPLVLKFSLLGTFLSCI